MWKWEMVEVDGKSVWRRVKVEVVPPVVFPGGDGRLGRQATGDRRKAPIYPAAAEL